MLICIPNVLSREQVAHCRAQLEVAAWVDGKITAGGQAATAKHNLQLPQDSAIAREIGEAILEALAHNARFVSAALPMKIFPPMFNRYEDGGNFGIHIDNAIRYVPGTTVRVRTDVSATLFLTEPETYDGGELVIEDSFGAQAIKLAAGDMALYPSTSLHQVRTVTRGVRLAAFFWLQSMVRDDGQRTLLYDLDQSIQELSAELGVGHPQTIRLAGVYHNLIRRWADT